MVESYHIRRVFLPCKKLFIKEEKKKKKTKDNVISRSYKKNSHKFL